MEALLDIIPLHLQVKREAMMGAIKPERNRVFKSGDVVGNPVDLTVYMTPKFHFDMKFEVVI